MTDSPSIIVRATVIILCAMTLTSCGEKMWNTFGVGSPPPPPELIEKSPNLDNRLIHNVAVEDLTVSMKLVVVESDGENMTIGIEVLNPNNVPIQSIRSWVRYGEVGVTAEDLEIKDKRFSLFAPGEQEIDEEKGIVKIGVAANESVLDEEILFATFKLKVQKGKHAMLSFHNWKAAGDGHTAVISWEDNTIKHVLQAPSSLEL